MNQLINFAKECIEQYAKYDNFHECYDLKVCDLPDFVQNEFAAMIFSDDESLASEATGPDNTNWNKKMLPILLKYLKNSTDKDESAEFINIWRDCVTDYVSHRMQQILDNFMSYFNHDHKSYLFDSNHTRLFVQQSI